MSTKTTFKRVALVAVASLGLGVLASAPSNAAPSAAFGTLIGDSTAGQQAVNGLATMVISYNDTITTVSTSGVGSIVSAVASSEGNNDTATVSSISGGTFTITDADAATDTGTVTITLTSAVAGDQVISMTPYTSSGSLGTAVTKTLTWVAALSKNTYDHSYAYLTGDTTTVPSVLSADTTTAASATVKFNYDATLNSSIAKAAVWVKQFSIADTTTASTLASGKGKETIVEITGAGSLGATATAASGSVLTTAATSAGGANAVQYYIFSDGRTGDATITVKVNGVLLATKTVSFYGASASYAVGTATTDVLSKLYLGVGETATVKFVGLDKAGKTSSSTPTISNAITDTATVATVAVATNVVTVTGVKVGKTTVYAANAAAKADATIISAGVSVEVTAKTAKTVTMSFDKTSYAPGEKMTLTVKAVDANGRPVADGTRALLAASATANILPNGTLPAASVDLVSGSADYVLYAPASAGTLTITAKEGAAVDAVIAGGTAATITASTTIASPFLDAAQAAAEEATAAANDATDAALSAAEAAEAATAMAQEAVDAVAELSAQVTSLISALRAQITALTNLVVKIQKKVKA